jgi:hypothetical protein
MVFKATSRFDCENTVYGEVYEEIPTEILELLGQTVVLSHNVEANLFYNFTCDRHVVEIIHLVSAGKLVEQGFDLLGTLR